jgi:hypothetical protein
MGWGSSQLQLAFEESNQVFCLHDLLKEQSDQIFQESNQVFYLHDLPK